MGMESGAAIKLRARAMKSTVISLTAATAAATDKQLKPTTFSQCQHFLKMDILFCFTVRTNVRGKVLSAPVRLMKSPRKGSIAATKIGGKESTVEGTFLTMRCCVESLPPNIRDSMEEGIWRDRDRDREIDRELRQAGGSARSLTPLPHDHDHRAPPVGGGGPPPESADWEKGSASASASAAAEEGGCVGRGEEWRGGGIGGTHTPCHIGRIGSSEVVAARVRVVAVVVMVVECVGEGEQRRGVREKLAAMPEIFPSFPLGSDPPPPAISPGPSHPFDHEIALPRERGEQGTKYHGLAGALSGGGGGSYGLLPTRSPHLTLHPTADHIERTSMGCLFGLNPIASRDEDDDHIHHQATQREHRRAIVVLERHRFGIIDVRPSSSIPEQATTPSAPS
uniref:Uncharacterized protein n=1 Tax=Oryza glumipatula TaxID=40148 RepID=A0A0D9ZB08_9ORYZ